ncbi:MAG: glycosyltransferase family 4 protein [Acidimicrobiales bacterium]
MRVGMICPYSLTIPGGVQNQILGLARALRAQGVDTRVLGPCDGPPPDAGVTPLGNSLPTAANGSVAPIAPDPAAQLRIIRALRDEEFDVLHIHEPMAPGPTMTATMLKQAPIVATFHRAGSSRSYRYLGRGVRYLQRRLEVCVAVSEEAAQVARAQLGGEYEILFNGVDTERFSRGDNEPADNPTIFFVGRHEPRKGLRVLLDAMSYLSADVTLWIASDGPETDELKSQVAGDPRIVWLGRIDDQEKISYMRKATAFCAPSLSGESFGIVLLEAMAARTPVVASDIAGYAGLARGGQDAVLVPAGDCAALGAALESTLAGGAEVERRVDSGCERAEEFSMDRLAARYLNLYEKAIGSAPAATFASRNRGFFRRASDNAGLD